MLLLRLQVSLIPYVILKRALWELDGLEDYCLLSKGDDLEQVKAEDKQARTISPKASPYVPTWLVEDICFTHLLPYDIDGP